MNYSTLDSVRETTKLLVENPDTLQHFNIHFSKIDTVTETILTLIQRDYAAPKDIPFHSRWRHFEVAPQKNQKIHRLEKIIKQWKLENVNDLEITRRLLDLFVVSVLLDAGAGPTWKYKPVNENEYYSRSEGLALASLDWFMSGGFSSSKSEPFRVDAKALKNLGMQDLIKNLQVSDENPLVGPERVNLLSRLGHVCESFPEFFTLADSDPRPGHLLDYILSHSSTIKTPEKITVEIDTLWHVVMKGFSGVWPETRTKLDGKSLGDVWPSKAMQEIAKKNPSNVVSQKGLVVFHKLSQWLTYSLMEPMALVKIEFNGLEKMTGLAEYRNGGLFIDMGVLEFKKPVEKPKFNVFDDEVVEWRGLTVGLLDIVGKQVCDRLKMSAKELPLVKVLEAGTWKAGREIAAKLRPDTKGPPIEIISDGTVF